MLTVDLGELARVRAECFDTCFVIRQEINQLEHGLAECEVSFAMVLDNSHAGLCHIKLGV